MRVALAGVLAMLAAAAPAGAADVDAIVQASSGTTLAQARAAARTAGLTPGRTLRSVRAFHVVGPASGLRDLRRSGAIRRAQRNRPIRYLTDTSHRATRAADVRSSGLDGSGVGVGVVDTGVDVLHPDLADRVATMHRVAGPAGVPVPGPAGDAAHGHGTHVAGIVAGTGAASGGRFRGAAPGATIHAFAMGGGTNLINPAWAWDWILQHNHELDPPIRVVNNSFGMLNATETAGHGYDPDYVQYALVDKLVAAGITVVFAAGNDGGDGAERRTSDFCQVPARGVICVANYDDLDSGSLAGAVDPGSSRGARGRFDTYPDLMAPGAAITSTCRPFLPLCTLGTHSDFPLEYSVQGGTSMAAPHVAGIVAQLLQARPDLTPAHIDDALVSTARPVATGAEYEPDRGRPGLTSFDKGHGLVDAQSALEHVLRAGAPAPVAPSTLAAPPVPAAPAPARPLRATAERRGRRLVVRLTGADGLRVRVRVRRGRRVLARRTLVLRGGHARLAVRVGRGGRLRVDVEGRRVRVA